MLMSPGGLCRGARGVWARPVGGPARNPAEDPRVPPGQTPSSGELKGLLRVGWVLLRGAESRSDHFAQHGARVGGRAGSSGGCRAAAVPPTAGRSLGRPSLCVFFLLLHVACSFSSPHPSSLCLRDLLFPHDLGLL